MKKIATSDLVGIHTLDTAFVMSVLPEDPDGWADRRAQVVSFGMNGKTYSAAEDPSDGYRSSLDYIEEHEGHTEALKGAALVGRKVKIVHVTQPDIHSYDDGCDILRFVDVDTYHVWGEIGTANSQDYYPRFVLSWNPMESGQ